MKNALIIVDVQNDFLPGGALEAPEGDKIIEPLTDLAKEADYVIATRDWHPPDHISFAAEPTFEDKSWPRHCVQGSQGARLHPEIEKIADVIVSKGTDAKIEAYSGFDGKVEGSGEYLVEWLADHEVDAVLIGGLVDEYCVKATAIDARDEGLRTTFYSQASAALTEAGAKEARREMANLGVKISDRVPRGDRTPTREEALEETTNAILDEAEDAEHSNYHILSAWYTTLLTRVRERAEQDDSAFIVMMPDAFIEEVKVFEIPEDK